jgi:acetolactate synthase-1/2/3 large subunit
MELQSAVREGAKLTVVVFAEGSWSMEVPNEQLRYGRTFGTEMGAVRWDRVAEGLGATGFYVDGPDDLEAAISAAKSARGPALVCVKTDLIANLSIPPAVAARFGEVYNAPVG